ncbi:MAG TPA: TlpA disulfide reductase family protein [Polyangiaceae bacterium]
MNATNPVKPTKDVRQVWVLGLLVLGLVLMFAFIVLPYVDPGKKVDVTAPDFTLPVIHGAGAGQPMRLSALAGKVVVLDFWASWCGPCKKQMPILDRVAQDYAETGVTFLGVSTDTEADAALAFLKATPVSYSSVLDLTGEVSRDFGVTGLPTLVIIDAQGKVTHNDARLVGERSLRDLIEAAR